MHAVVNNNFLAYESFIRANAMPDYGIEMVEFERLCERSDGFVDSCVSSAQLHRTTIGQLSGQREGRCPNVSSDLTFRTIAVSLHLDRPLRRPPYRERSHNYCGPSGVLRVVAEIGRIPCVRTSRRFLAVN